MQLCQMNILSQKRKPMYLRNLIYQQSLDIKKDAKKFLITCVIVIYSMTLNHH